ncbi:MAG: TIGR01777 family oxidoreductase [Mycobacterium sp.]
MATGAASSAFGRASIAIAGSSGLIGSALVAALRAADHRVLRIVRRTPVTADELHWNPDTGEFDASGLAGVHAVVNLCGVNVGDKRWSGAFKQSLRDSRITPTEVLASAVAAAEVPVLVNSSAVGYYGDTRHRVVDESAPPGSNFLAQLCQDWEAATVSAEVAGARVVMTRTGLVLAPAGGMLGRLRTLFSLGLGARIGNGRQYLPWITLEDQVRALLFAITHDELTGPVNMTGPAPVTNAEFTAALGRALNRPTPWLLPGFAARAVVGELADEGLLIGQRAIPAALERAGFQFHHNTVGEALGYTTASTDSD